MIVLTIPGRPQPQERTRPKRTVNGTRMVEGARTRAWKSFARQHLALGMRGQARLEGVVAAAVVVIFPLAASKRRRAPVPRSWCDLDIGDVDNCLKAVYDAANTVVWRDDAQVSLAPTARIVGAQDEDPRVELAAIELSGGCPAGLTAASLLRGLLSSWASVDFDRAWAWEATR